MKQDQQDAKMDTPLLEDVLENQNSSQGASISGAVFNISTTMIGAGIMSIPAAIKVLGIVPGFLLILVVAFFTEVTVEFLLRYTKSGKSTTYAGIVGESFGAIGSVAVQICVIITLFGALIIYLIIIGKLLIHLVQESKILSPPLSIQIFNFLFLIICLSLLNE